MSPPTRGSSKPSSSSRSPACDVAQRDAVDQWSERRLDGGAEPVDHGLGVPGRRRHVTSRLERLADRGGQVGGGEVGPLEHACTSVPTSAPPGMAPRARAIGAGSAASSAAPAPGRAWRAVLVGGVSASSGFGLAPDRGPVVRGARDARVGRAPPAASRTRSKGAASSSAPVRRLRMPPRGRTAERPAPPPRAARGGARRPRRPRRLGAAAPRPGRRRWHRGRRATAPAGSSGVGAAGPPHDHLMAGPGQRHVEEPQVLAPPPRAPSSGAARSSFPSARRRSCARWRCRGRGRPGRRGLGVAVPHDTGSRRSGTRGPCCGGS